MLQELTPRTQAIRKNLKELMIHTGNLCYSIDSIIIVLGTIKNAEVLILAFKQLRASVIHLAEHIENFSENAQGEPDEIMRVYYIDKILGTHLDKSQGLIFDLLSFFGTSELSEGAKLALIMGEIEKAKKFAYIREDIYMTIKSHYADQNGNITTHLEQSRKGKKSRECESQIWYLDLHSK